jgi:hypothetical protein
MNKLWEWTNTGDSVPVTAKAMLPSTSAVTIDLAHGVSMITFVNTVPISENKSINRFALIRNFMGWEGFDDYARSADSSVFLQGRDGKRAVAVSRGG